MALRAEVDQDVCISAGRCVADAPTAFAFNDDEIAVALPGAAELSRTVLVNAARDCPSGAITVYEDDVAIELD